MKTKRLFFLGIAFLSLASLTWIEEDFIFALNEKLEQHYKNYPQVKVHLFFNQDKYTAGDTAYYKARFLSDALRPIEGRQLLCLDLVDASSKVVQKQNFTITDGVGHNQLAISPELPPGSYTVRVYNSWMRNFDPDLLFSKVIILSGKNEFQQISSSEINLSFFPEGNHLIAAVSNKVVIKASKNGRITGNILEGNTVITNFSTDDQGLGFFIFTPEFGKTYRAQIESTGTQYSLPSAEEDGCVVLATPTKEALRLILAVPQKSDLREQNLYLVMSAHGKIYFSAAFRFGEKEFVPVLIPQKNRPAGVAVISLLTSKGKTIAERLVYNDIMGEIQVKMTTEKKIYRPREKINFELAVTDELGNPIRTDIAVSAVSKKLFPLHDAQNTYAYADDIYLFGEFPDESFSINRNNPDWKASLDNFMITKQWKRYSWQDIIGGSKKTLSYGFKKMLNLEGVALNKETGKPVPDSTLIMVYLQDHMMGYEAWTGKDGVFDLPFLFDFWGADRLFYLLEDDRKELRNVEIKLVDDFLPVKQETAYREVEKPDEYTDFVLKKNLINNSFNYFLASTNSGKVDLDDLNAAFEDEVMGADIEVDVVRYIVFQTMEDLIREVIPSVLHRRSNGKPIVRIVLSPSSAMPTGDPLYVIDGVLSKNTEYFLALKPSEVLTVKVVKDIAKLNHFGAMGKNGIVFIQTKKPNPAKLLAMTNSLPIEGLTKPLNFVMPDYSVDPPKKERIPDFRSALYWNPTAKTDATGKTTLSFFSSDDLGLIKVIVKGMTTDGRPFSGETEVEISLQTSRN